MQNKLPQGWVECQLGEVFETSSGGTPKRGNPEYYQNGTIPWLKSGELNNSIIYSAEEFITGKGLNNSSAKIFPRGSLLIALYGATVGKLGILDFDSATNQAVCCIYQNTYYDRDFLFYYLLLKKEYLVNQGKGGAQPNISQEIVKSLLIPFPPLNEQKRIVEKIESEFAKIDEGLEHLEHAKEQLKQYRQSVLKSAFDGKLHKTSVWKETTLNECTSKLGDGLHGTPKYSDDGDFYFINGNNLNDGIIEIKKDTKKVNFEEYQKKKKELNNNTVLVSINGTIGNTAFYNNEKVILGKSACYFNLINNVDKYFIRYLLKTNYFLNYANKNATGSTIKNVSLKIMREFNFKLPLTLDEQKKIVEEIEKRFAVADEVEKVVEQNIEKSKQLKQSILKKAFEGRLVPQDPTDEPASILLEKIKQERSKK